jgi:hypothetical protein
MLVGRRLFDGASEAAIIRQLLDPEVSPPSRYAREHIHFDEVIAHALSPDPARRYPTALAMAADIEDRVTPAPASEVAAWAMDLAGNAIERRALRAARIEAAPTVEDAALPARTDAVPDDGSTVEMVSPPALAEGSRTLEMSQIYFDAAHGPPSTPRPTPLPSPSPPPAAYPGQQLQSSDRWSWPMSQVSSVSLTRPLPVPPPLPPARVRLLAASGAIAALVSAIVSSALLSLVPRSAPEEAPAALAATASPPTAAEPVPDPSEDPLADAGSETAADEAADAGAASSDADASTAASSPAATTAAPRPRPLKVSAPAKAPAGPVKLPAPRGTGPTKR